MVTFLIVLSILVVFHEFGHFLAARYFGVAVESFSLGFGPRLLGVRRNGTDYKVCLLPVGGYVKMAGMNESESAASEPGSFQSKPRWQRLIIIAMGPAFNAFLAVALLAGLYVYQFEQPAYAGREARIGYVAGGTAADRAGLQPGDVVRSLDGRETPTWRVLRLEAAMAAGRPVAVEFEREGQLLATSIDILEAESRDAMVAPGWFPKHRVLLGQVVDGRPAAAAGFQRGDELLEINGREVVGVDHVIDSIADSGGAPLQFGLLRDGERRSVTVRPELRSDDAHWRIGVALSSRYEVERSALSPTQALIRSAAANYVYAGLIFRTLQRLVAGSVPIDTLEGPVGIYEHTQDAAAYGFGALVELMALISINLAIVNLVPVPVLDGGQILVLLVESTMRREVSVAVKARMFQVGLAFMVILFGIVMYNDLARKLAAP